MTTQAEALGLLRRGAKIVVTHRHRGDPTYHFHPFGDTLTHRRFKALRHLLQPEDPGLEDGEPQSWVLDPEKQKGG